MNVSNFTLAPSAKSDDLGRGDELNQLIATFRRRSRLFVSVLLVIVAAVMLVTFQQTPRYTATSNVMIDTRKREVSNIQDVLSGLPADSSVVDTEVEILKSRSLAERVVVAEGLDQDPEFNAKLHAPNVVLSLVEAPVAAIGDLFSAHAPQGEAARTLKATKVHEAVVDKVLSRLKVRRSGLTYVIDVAFESEDPVKAAHVANTFASLYLTQQLQDKYDATQQANQWLNERLAELQPQVAQAEAAVEQYKAQHGLLASVGSSLTEQEISNLNNQLAQAQADQAERDARLRTAQQVLASGASGDSLSGPLGSQTITQLRSQAAELSSKVADLETKYGPRHPEVQRAQRALADNQAQIRDEVARQVSSLQAEDQVARQRVASLQASLGQAKGTLMGDNAASVELADLQRKASAASTLYDSLLNRAKQTSTDQGSETSDSRIVSHAKIPNRPSFPNKPLNLALGLVLGLAGAIGSVFLMEALDSGLATSEDVERMLGLPHLGAIPALDSTTDGKALGVAPGQYVIDKPLSAFAEAFRNLRASILFSKVDTPVKVVLVTSSLPGEGKTTTTFCLGRSMAMSGARVVIVDCDLRRRNINRLLGVEPEVGLIEVLQGQTSLDEAMVFDEPTGAWFLPLSKSTHTPKDLFGSAAMDRLIATLRERFDMVLLDTAPVIPVSDTRILAPKADVVVFLAQWRRTPRKAIEAAFSLLKSVGADIAGVALTLVDAQQQAKYGYGDSGYYYRSYRKYYSQ
jgi:polysaccharide biosynthesis transport protein